METVRASRIGLGTPMPLKRKSLGIMYLSNMHNRVLHSNLLCHKPYDTTKLVRVPAYEEDDKAHFIHEDTEYVAYEVCDECPVIDSSWRDKAACFGSEEDFFTRKPNKRAELIEENCDTCPVQLECLENGIAELGHGEKVSAIYGGVYLSPAWSRRKRVIDMRRKELLAGGPV